MSETTPHFSQKPVDGDAQLKELIMADVARRELGSLVQEEANVDVQIESLKKREAEQGAGTNQKPRSNEQLIGTLRDKKERIIAAQEQVGETYGYALSTELGDNTDNILEDGVLRGREDMQKEQPPQNPRNESVESKISYTPPSDWRSVEEINSVVYQTPEGNVVPVRKSGGGEEVVLVNQETSVPGLESDHHQENTFYSKIKEELADLESRKAKALEYIRDHSNINTGGPDELLKWQDTARWADRRIEKLKVRLNENKGEDRAKDQKGVGRSDGEVLVTTPDVALPEKEVGTEIVQQKISTSTTIESSPTENPAETAPEPPPPPATETPITHAVESSTENVPSNDTPPTTAVEKILSRLVVEDPRKAEGILNAIDPTRTWAERELTPFERAMVHMEPDRAKRILNTVGAAPETRARIEQLLGVIQNFSERTEQKAKEQGKLDLIRTIGKKWREVPWKVRLGIGVALGIGAGGTILSGPLLSAVFAAGIAGRMLGGASTFVVAEAALQGWVQNRWQDKNKEWGKKAATWTGAVAGVLVGGGTTANFLYHHYFESAGNIIPEGTTQTTSVAPETPHPESSMSLPEELTSSQEAADLKALKEYAAAKTLEEKAEIAKIVGSTPEQMDIKAAALTGHAEPVEINSKEIFENAQKEIHTAMPLSHETTPEVSGTSFVHEGILSQTPDTLETTYTVHEGDKLWNIIKEKIPEIRDLDGEGRQSNAIANIIEQIKKDPESFGVSGGNIDHLSAGDSIDLEKVHGVLENAKISVDGQDVGIIERASGLTDAESSHIIENNVKIAEWHTAHPDIPLTAETVDKILSRTADSVPSVEVDHLSEITKDYTLSMPDTGGRTIEQLSAEALALDTEAMFHADVQTMFGSKGFFGYGFLGTNGEKSVDWLDLKSRPVREVLSKQFIGTSVGEEGAVQKFGIDSPGAVDKIKGYIKMLIEKSGENPNPGESIEHFTKRGISAILTKK